MKIRFVEVNSLQAGMRIAEDIYITERAPMVAEGSFINESVIKLLKEWGIFFIAVYEDEKYFKTFDDALMPNPSMSLFIQSYEETLNLIKTAIEGIKLGQSISAPLIKQQTTKLLKKIVNNNHVLNHIQRVKNKDEYTYVHSVNVAILSAIIGHWLSFPEEKVIDLACSALLHDIGKSKIDDNILKKPGSLTEGEYATIKKHSLFGYNILSEIAGFSEEVALTALNHHERYDGSGYPKGIKANEINICARIVAIADVYDAMTSDRIYRSKISPFKVVNEISSNIHYFDPEILYVFKKNIYYFNIGVKVKLSNNEVGEIIFIDANNPSRPVIKCRDKYYNLLKEQELQIVDVVL